jgi:hypothetical protein
VDLADRIALAGDRCIGDSLVVQLDLLLDAYTRTDPPPPDLARLRDRVEQVRRRCGSSDRLDPSR